VLNRGWHIEGMSVRPDHRMVAHTGFLTHARLLPGELGEKGVAPQADLGFPMGEGQVASGASPKGPSHRVAEGGEFIEAMNDVVIPADSVEDPASVEVQDPVEGD
jgi:hypothetical protein